ncbi:hypothetical protein AVEN_187770-1 [Araneus ventricosus]|uniref:Uncharacterized protein n=1 Tax=Araneus ventricosus TaxID=182803 RepID=A0A4Y2C2W0_ARAVE|nr:hypothetical protein AVEN_187770-1 [Araneus ventricosus]
MSGFETTRRLFWDGPRNFEPRSGDGDMIWHPLTKHLHNTSGRTFDSPMYHLTYNRPNTRRNFSGIEFRTLKPPVPRLTPYH